jgi:uncharacterized protein DUF4431
MSFQIDVAKTSFVVCLLTACQSDDDAPLEAPEEVQSDVIEIGEIGPLDANGCLNATAPVYVSGELQTQIFPGPPNYESIADGDTEERAHILMLPRHVCLVDGELAQGQERFAQAHLYSTNPQMNDLMSAANGTTVSVSGEGFGAHTGHHRAPLVIEVSEIQILSE